MHGRQFVVHCGKVISRQSIGLGMARFPFTPFPRGWFFYELAEKLPQGKLMGRLWMGQETVA